MWEILRDVAGLETVETLGRESCVNRLDLGPAMVCLSVDRWRNDSYTLQDDGEGDHLHGGRRLVRISRSH